jgi:AcrR family transcriptional regulator
MTVFCRSCFSTTLRGIKDSPPYLHDGRALTLEDSVEFFNLVLELKLSAEEKRNLAKELAGEVDARILDAARKIFLERGFEGASIDEIAEVARSGKPTIYARFRDKRALFTEVVTRDILSRITEFKTEVPTGAKSDELSSLPAFAPERLATTARLFLDLVAVPLLLRALFEVNLKTLDAEIDAHVARSVAFFLAACRNGGVS